MDGVENLLYYVSGGRNNWSFHDVDQAATAGGRLTFDLGSAVIGPETLLLKGSAKAELATAAAAGRTERTVFTVDVSKSMPGSAEYDLLNNLRPNANYNLSDGTKFATNANGFVDEISFTPTLEKMSRDSRQTAVGKEGVATDVGGHVRACSMGGTCDRYNLFPQDSNFNNSAYKRFENEIRGALESQKNVGPIQFTFARGDVTSARPDSLLIEYSIDGVKMSKYFRNEAGQ